MVVADGTVPLILELSYSQEGKPLLATAVVKPLSTDHTVSPPALGDSTPVTPPSEAEIQALLVAEVAKSQESS
ncbi:MAG: hypothetical protein JOZ57_00495 [Abitibacteriaceae bacterium]|nr:hypothetical protein [Abditibacteriaceae bacterium]